MDENPLKADESPIESPPKKGEVSKVGAERRISIGGWSDLFAGRVALAVMVLAWIVFLLYVLWKLWRV